jgi:hypothetical protein
MKLYWTEEMDAALRVGWRTMPAYDLARHIGVSESALSNRAKRLDLGPSGRDRRDWRPPECSHAAADERSAEILRRAGMQV